MELQHDSSWTFDLAKDEIRWLFKTRRHYKELELNGMFGQKHQKLFTRLERHNVQRQLGGQHNQWLPSVPRNERQQSPCPSTSCSFLDVTKSECLQMPRDNYLNEQNKGNLSVFVHFESFSQEASIISLNNITCSLFVMKTVSHAWTNLEATNTSCGPQGGDLWMERRDV